MLFSVICFVCLLFLLMSFNYSFFVTCSFNNHGQLQRLESQVYTNAWFQAVKKLENHAIFTEVCAVQSLTIILTEVYGCPRACGGETVVVFHGNALHNWCNLVKGYGSNKKGNFSKNADLDNCQWNPALKKNIAEHYYILRHFRVLVEIKVVIIYHTVWLILFYFLSSLLLNPFTPKIWKLILLNDDHTFLCWLFKRIWC